MCLAINEYKCDQTIAWKILLHTSDGYVTPYKRKRVTNPLIAEEEPAIHIDSQRGPILEGGAIHCYRSKVYAEEIAMTMYFGFESFKLEIFEVIGENCIACNNNEIAFKKITFKRLRLRKFGLLIRYCLRHFIIR